MSRGFKVVLTALAVLLAGGAIVGLHLENRALRRRIEQRRPLQQQGATLREENERWRALLADHARDTAAASASVQAQVQAARAEIATLEQRAEETRAASVAQAARDETSLAANRDPLHGLTRLEYFRDRGQATPSAAFQSLVAAVIRGDEGALARLSLMSAETRARAEALIARLPENARSQWTPEKLGQLWFTGALTELPALELAGETLTDADSAVITLRIGGRNKDENVKLKLTREGWRVVLPSGAIDSLEKKISGP